MARSYINWGEPLIASRPGAIAVLSRPPDPAAGHVGFLISETGETITLLGGNQHDAVSVATFPKSRLIALRWPRSKNTSETTVAQRTTESTSEARLQAPAFPGRMPADPVFASALAHVLEMEGGYTDDPADPGGPTNFGITLADYARHLNETISEQNRTRLVDALQRIEPATVQAIYVTRYWTPTGCASLSSPIAFFHFDTAVNMGTGTAVRMLQTALGCEIDGIFGPVTQDAARAATAADILASYASLRRRRYRSLATFPRFGRGWLARVDTTLSRALALDTASTQGTPMPPDTAAQQPSVSAPAAAEPKWWGASLTIWGAVVAGLAAVAPVLSPEITPDVVHHSADQVEVMLQAACGLAGTIAAIVGRLRATQPLVKRAITLKI